MPPELPKDLIDAPGAAPTTPSIQPGPIPDREALQGVTITPSGRPRIDIFATDKNKVSNVSSAGGTGKTIGSMPGDLVDVPSAMPQPMSGETHDAIATNGPYSSILNAFEQGFAHEWGAAKFGPDLKKALTDVGILYDAKDEPTVAKAFNEAFLRPAANALDVSLRTIGGTFAGIHDAAIAAGHPFDALAAGMEAFPLAGAELGRLGWFPSRLPKPVVTPEEADLQSKAMAAGAYELAKKKKEITDLREAADLRVIGPTPEASPFADGTPTQAAARAHETLEDRMNAPFHSVGGAGVPLEERMFQPAGAPFTQDAWQARFDHYVGRLETSEDAKNLINNSVDVNDAFVEARSRGGAIPAEHLNALSDATGIPVEEMDLGKLATKFDYDKKFRVATELMLKFNDDVFEAARRHKGEQSLDSRKALIAAIIKHDVALEYVIGMRGEWGRTGNVMQEFMKRGEDAKGVSEFLKEKRGEKWTNDKIDEIADQLGGLNSREEVARFTAKIHKPDFMDKAVWYWTQSILSGFVTHTKYIFANAAYIAHDTLLATPAAGVSGAIRQAMSKEQIERVYIGEAFAKMYGIIAGVPDALHASYRAVKSGVQTPLPGQANIGPLNPVTGLGPKPIGGVAGEILGVPSRGISGIHSFFNFLGYHAEIEAQAYRTAAKAGLHPLEREFWIAQGHRAANPTEAMMQAGIDAGKRANFVQDLGPYGKAVQAMLYKIPAGRFIIPFLKVPGNIFNAVQEGSPLAFLPGKSGMLDALRGTKWDKATGRYVPTARKLGEDLTEATGITKDMAWGRLAGGSAVMGWAAYMTVGDNITGSGPADPKQHAEWLLTHQPYSFKKDGYWHSYMRFGPVGGWLGLAANITDASMDVHRALQNNAITEKETHQKDQDLQEAANRLVLGFTTMFEEGGWQGMADLVSTLRDPNRSKASRAGALAATALPFSSFLKQGASFIDPLVRDTQTFVDGIRSTIPLARESIVAKPDWTGAPIANPMYHSVFANKIFNTDSVDREVQRLNIKPTLPENNIHGVRLSPELYNEFRVTAGTLTRADLHKWIDRPRWSLLPDIAKAKLIDEVIKSSRTKAAALIQIKQMGQKEDIVHEALTQRKQEIMGGKHRPTAFERPE